MSVRDVQKICREFIEHKVSADNFALHLVEAIIVDRKNHPAMIQIAQALFFMAPSPGDGS